MQVASSAAMQKSVPVPIAIPTSAAAKVGIIQTNLFSSGAPLHEEL